MKKKIFLTVFLCCGMFAAMAQTAADSLAIVSANWQTEPLQKGMLYKKGSIQFFVWSSSGSVHF